MMGLVVDVDAHFEPGEDWLRSYPDLAKRLPTLDWGMLAIKGAFGDFVDAIPEDRRPPRDELVPPGLLKLFAQEKSEEKDRAKEFEGASMMGGADAPARLKWMDAQGIDIQNVICLSGMSYLGAIDDLALRQEVTRSMNDWLADTCEAGGQGRLLPVTNLEYTDLDWAVEELTRMRQRGSRIVLVPGAPVNDVSPAHPMWDKLWQAITDNGMVAMFHVGFGRVTFEKGWTNMGGDTTLLRQFGCSFHTFEPMLFLSALALGGVFARHPTLTVLTAEVGVGWLPMLINQLNDRATGNSQMWLGEWKYPLLPGDYIKRNVRVTPLGWGQDQPLDAIMERVPEDMIVFSSDFPHFEGFRDPQGHYAQLFEKISPSRREQFLGGSILAAYERMGDPLEVAREPAAA